MDADDLEATRIKSSRKTADGDVDTVVSTKPTAADLHKGPPGAGEVVQKSLFRDVWCDAVNVEFQVIDKPLVGQETVGSRWVLHTSVVDKE